VRRQDVIHGVTTAAGLWFATVVGLCFGVGEWRLGGASLASGVLVLWPLNYVENNMKREHTGTLTVAAPLDTLTQDELRHRIETGGCTPTSWSITIDRANATLTIACRVIWRARLTDDRVPTFVAALSHDSKVAHVKWEPLLS
jgi:putative Mg2+ transporter-C (MgtC) family protein